jgi:Domain of unknown function (DUF3846)
MRAIVIWADRCEVVEVDLPEQQTRQLAAIQRYVGRNIGVALRLGNGDVVFVNEEGILPHKNQNEYFTLPGTLQWYAGNGIVTGAQDADGNITPAKSSLTLLQQGVMFRRFSRN